MALVGHLHKIVWGGTLAVTESWSCSLHFISPTLTPLDTTLIQSALEQWIGRPNTRINAAASLNWLKVNEVSPTTGRYLDQGNPRTYYWPTAVKSGYSQLAVPDVAVACSTVTAQARGRGSKGRFFAPASMGASADGRTDAPTAFSVATSAAQLITDLNGSNEGECYVWSQVGQVQNEIIAVKVGRVNDHQSRRRKNLIEDYQSVPIS